MDNLIKISDLQAFENAIKGNAMLVFSTTWCPDCHFLKTFIDDLVAQNPEWTFYYIDRDEMVIPSFVAYRDGKEVGRYVNKLRKTQQQIQEFIDQID